MPNTQSQRLGKYEILAEIGKGGFATVYRARDPDLGREVALKVLDPLLMRDPAWVARFRQEARTIAALDHPRIVPIYEIGQAEGILFIAMKLLPGGSLADRIKAGPLPWAEVVRLTAEIAEALDFAHDRQVLHRDLKPANVLLDADGHVVLTDFGFARLVADHSLSVSVSGGVVGTPAYIAPEVWEGEPPGRPADLYALGCIVYEMVSGVQPFGDATTPAVMRAHFLPLKLPDSWPAGTPTGLGDVLAVALAQAPADRYARAGELAAAVAGLTTDALAEPYVGLQAAIAAGDWTQSLALASQIRTQKPDYRDVAALEAQALAGQERAARAEQASAWRAEAESALAEGDRVAAALAIKQWAALTPGDPTLAQLQARLQEAAPPAAPSSPTPMPARRFPVWIATSAAALVLLVAVVLLTQLARRDEDSGSQPTATATATSASIAAASSATASHMSQSTSFVLAHTPQQSDIPTRTVIPSATPSPAPSATHTDKSALQPSSTPTSAQASLPTSSYTPTVEPSATLPAKPAFVVNSGTAVNVRSGPGTVYSVIGSLQPADTHVITGRASRNDWWQFEYKGQKGWVSDQVVKVNDLASSVKIVAIPPTPQLPAPRVTLPKAFTPGTGRILFNAGSEWNQPHDIYVMNEDGSEKKRLTSGMGSSIDGRFSPDGSKIVFISDRTGDGWHVFVMNSDGTDPRDLAPSFVHWSAADWSPDGSKIAYCCRPQGICLMNADGTGIIRLTSSEDIHPRWSNHGERILFHSLRSGRWQVYVMQSDGSGLRNLSRSEFNDWMPAWSPDDSQIAFVRWAKAYQDTIYVMQADGSDLHALTGTAHNEFPVWSPDGSHIAFNSSNGGRLRNVFIMKADGSEVERLTTGDEWPSDWWAQPLLSP